MADALMNKHFSGTPLEEAIIGTVPYLRDVFHNYVAFPPYLHSSVPGKVAHSLTELEKLSQLAYSEDYKNRRIMNLNNLQDRKDEMKNLGFSKETIEKMEELIKKDSPSFKLYESAPATKGQLDYVIPIKRSALSDYYYLNKFEVIHNQARPLAEGEKFMVIAPQPDGKNLVRKLETMTEAIDYFKKQEGNSELAVGKDARSKTTLAKMENGKVNYVERDFQRTFRQPPIPQTFYLDEGQGFTKEQAGNLVQGRAVYRDDLLSSQGVPFKAWTMLNFEKARDRYNNYPLRYFHDPAYQFDLKAELSQYNIKDMENPKSAEKIETAIRNGNRAFAVVENKNGEPFDMYIEAAVRWRKPNFYHLDGKPEKREEFLKPGIQQDKVFEWNLQQNKQQEQSRGMGVGR